MNNKLDNILIIDNDKTSNELITMHLRHGGYNIKNVYNGNDIRKHLTKDVKIIILDIFSVKGDGIEVLKEIKKISDIPVIILTSKNDAFYKVLTLDLGADDYIVKPFDHKELLARMRSIMRRYSYSKKDKADDVISLPELLIDNNSNEVKMKNEFIKLPPKEFELLYFLIRNANKTYSREELMNEIWDYEYAGDSRTVDVHIKRIRSKLAESNHWSLETVWGKGYKFCIK